MCELGLKKMTDPFDDKVKNYEEKTNEMLNQAKNIFYSGLDRVDKVKKIRALIQEWIIIRPSQCGEVNKITMPAMHEIKFYLKALNAQDVDSDE